MNTPLGRLPRVPPFQSGDRLTRDEFERRYHATPHIKKAELIEGEVHVESRVSYLFHGGPHADAAGWIGFYTAYTAGAGAGINTTVRLDNENEPQPDVILFVKPVHGGRVSIDAEGYITGAPEFVFEVSASTVSIDLGKRLNAYRRNQILEYVVWRVYDSALDWFVYRSGQFDRLDPDPGDGLLKSGVFPGLWLDAPALLRRDLATVLTALNRGLASPDHAAFVERLARQMP
jgi:Uma2 family endonuclease